MKGYLAVIVGMFFASVFLLACGEEAGNTIIAGSGGRDIEMPMITGASLTGDHAPTWSWNTPDGATKFVYLLTCLEVDPDSEWTETTDNSYTPSAPLPSGQYRLYLKACDSNDNCSAAAGHSITIYSTGTLQQVDYLNGFFTGMYYGYDAAVSPDGKNVYTVGYYDNSIAVFDRDRVTGALTFSAVFQNEVGGVDGLDGASSVAVSEDGKSVYVTGYTDDALAVFDRDAATGALTFSTFFQDGVGGVDGLDEANSVAVSHDGKSVYVAGYNDNALAVFDRDTATGALTFSTFLQNGVGGVEGIGGAYSVAVSPDGKSVYVAGYDDNALAVFDRNTDTGVLAFQTFFQDDVEGDNLFNPCDVAVSPDGRHVYLLSYFDEAIVVYERNARNGYLARSSVNESSISVEGLDSPSALAISPDGTTVYITSEIMSGLGVFGRDVLDGSLSYIDALYNADEDVEGLGGSRGVAVSPCGRNVYIATSYGVCVFNLY